MIKNGKINTLELFENLTWKEYEIISTDIDKADNYLIQGQIEKAKECMENAYNKAVFKGELNLANKIDKVIFS